MVEEVIKISAQVEEANKGIQQVNTNVDKLQKNVDETSQSTKQIAAGFKLVGTAIKAAGIGLVIAAFSKLTTAMSENQKFADGTQKLFLTMGAIFRELVNVLEPLIGAFKALFTLDWDGLKSNLKELGTNVVNFTSNIAKSTAAAWDYASALVEMEKASKIAEAQGKKLMLQYQTQAEILRQARDDESKTIEERIRANKALGMVLEKQLAVEVANAQKRLEMARFEYNNNKENVDLQVKLIEAETELIDIRERITGQRSEQLVNENALLKEQRETRIDVSKRELDLSLEVSNEIIKNKINETRWYNESETEKTRVANEEAQRRIAIAEMERDAKIQIASFALGAIADLFGRESAAGKAAAIAQATINSYQAFTNTLANTPLPPPWPQIAAGATLVAGLAQVRQIIQTKIPNVYGGGFGMVSPGLGSAPSINIPGQSGINSIIAGFGQANNQPIQAYVVGSSVSSQQELDRKKLNNATFG